MQKSVKLDERQKTMPPATQWRVAPSRSSLAPLLVMVIIGALVVAPNLASWLEPQGQEVPQAVVEEAPVQQAQPQPEPVRQPTVRPVMVLEVEPVPTAVLQPTATLVPVQEWQETITAFLATGAGLETAYAAAMAYQEWAPELAEQEGRAMVEEIGRIHYPYPYLEPLWRQAQLVSWMTDDVNYPDRLWQRLGQEKAEADAQATAQAQPTAVPTQVPQPTTAATQEAPTARPPTMVPTQAPTARPPTAAPKQNDAPVVVPVFQYGVGLSRMFAMEQIAMAAEEMITGVRPAEPSSWRVTSVTFELDLLGGMAGRWARMWLVRERLPDYKVAFTGLLVSGQIQVGDLWRPEWFWAQQR